MGRGENAFHTCCEVESRGLELIEPYLEAVSFQGRYVVVGENLQAQAYGWDIFLQAGPEHSLTMDLKVVKETYPCLFLENYSNKTTGRLGWMHTGKMDLLGYLMLDSGDLTVMDFPALQQWANDNVLENGYPHVQQTKYTQQNDSWGVLVPKGHLRSALKYHYVEVVLHDPATYKLPH